MAHLITLPLEAPPDTLRVNVAYYDEEERVALTKSIGQDILGGPSRELTIPTPDFCSYYLYYKLRQSVPGYGSHDDVAQKWAFALAELDGQVQFAGGSVRLLQADGTSSGTSERIGEAIGLSVASRLHTLHEGDWSRIPISNTRKTFDFERIASDGRRFILLEAKGSSVENNLLKPSTVSEHKRSIKEKKAAATATERQNAILYGTIGVLDDRPNSVARCWLVDPPAGVLADPTQFRLITRLEFIAQWMSLLGPRSQMAAALRTRLSALRVVKDFHALDGVSLRTGSDSEFATETYDQLGKHNPWFASKSVVSNGPAGGHVYAVNGDVVLFLAIREQLVSLAAAQQFRAITEYTFPAATLVKTVHCTVPAARFHRKFSRFMIIPQDQRGAEAGYIRFSLTGHLHYCQSGVVLGVLPIPEAWRAS